MCDREMRSKCRASLSKIGEKKFLMDMEISALEKLFQYA